MKKIKPIKIIVAVVTALVFCIALAVPCFADSPTEGTDYVINTITFTDGNSAYQWLTENYDRVQRMTLYSSGELYGSSTNISVLTDSNDTQTFNVSIFVNRDVDGESTLTKLDTFFALFNLTSENTQLATASVYFVDGSPTILTGQPSVTIPNTYWGSAGLTMTCEYTTEYVPKENTTRSGMFGQLYNILRDAIFGKDVLLDDSQDFVLTQISTWMTYIIILLPILVVGVILFRIFCR